jgi:hypothetical protein
MVTSMRFLVCGQSVTTGAVGEVGEVGGFLIVTIFHLITFTPSANRIDQCIQALR